LAFDRLLEFLFVRFFSFSFLSCYFRVGAINALIKGEIEDHVWFEDRWMVASWCGLRLSRVGAGEEQA
jgi:hypothetical protein